MWQKNKPWEKLQNENTQDSHSSLFLFDADPDPDFYLIRIRIPKMMRIRIHNRCVLPRGVFCCCWWALSTWCLYIAGSFGSPVALPHQVPHHLPAARSRPGDHRPGKYIFKKGDFLGFFGFFEFFYYFYFIFWDIFWFFCCYFIVLYSTLLHLPPLRFHCVRGGWDRTVACDFGIGCQTL